MGLLKQLMIFGKSGLQGLPTRVTLPLRAYWPTRGYWGPPIHNMGSCGRLGESPNTWKHFGPEPTRAIEPRHRPPGQRWILEAGLRVGVRVGRPFGARRRSSVRYGTRLGDLKENWFLLFSNSTLNTHCALLRHSKWRPHTNTHTHTAVCLAVAGESILQREKQEEVRTHAPDSQTADRGSN